MEREPFGLPSGKTVELRGLTGFEVMLSRKKYKDDEIGLNAFMMSCGMGITEAAALAWLKEHLAGDFVAVTDRLQVMSGLTKDATKTAYKEFEADPGSEFRPLPGAEAVHDGGPDAAGDVER